MIVTNNDNIEIRVFPLAEDKTSIINILMTDTPGSLSAILDIVSKHSLDIIASMSTTLERGKLAKWDAIVDITNCKDVKKMESDLKASKYVKKILIKNR